MAEFFVYDYTGEPFKLFGTGHLIALAIICGVALFLIFGWKSPTEKGKRIARYTFAALLFFFESGWHIWNAYHGRWTIQTMLPLHICSVMVWVSIIMLLTNNYKIYEFAYFLGIGGALQPVLTPEAGIYGLPHFRAFQTLIVHGTLVLAPIYMTTIQGYRPTWRSFLKVAVVANIYMGIVMGINYLINANYMFLMRKPDTASLMDALGPWPWYILGLEAIGLVVFLLLYLPFIIKDARAAKTA